MSVIYWIIVGGIAGWLASMVMKTDAQMGMVANVVVGVIGAVLGGWVIGSYVWTSGTGFFRDIIISFIGAVILLAVYKMIGQKGGGTPAPKA